MSKHRFLTHFSATQVASRVFMHRLLSLAFVGASLTALAACGSTAADIAAKASAEAARLEALRLAELGTVALPAESSSPAHQIKTPYVNPGSTSITGSIGYTKASGLTIAGLKATPEAQGVSTDVNPPSALPTETAGYDFADLTLSAFYPTPSGADDDDDVPFLLIWQFAGADRKGSKGGTPLNTANGKFIAPGIEKFEYRIPEGQEDQFETAGLSESAGTVPRSRSAYIERMLDGFEPNKEIDDGAELSAETPRPLPYAGVKSRPSVIPGNSHLSRIVLDGSSTFWDEAGGKVGAASYATSGTPRTQDANIPSYDVELIFPKRDSTDWALRYSGFILMRAFYKSGDLATDAKESYINLFTYTSNHATDMTEPLKALFENNPSNEEKTQATATYKSVFAAWGVATENPNKHHFLYDDTVRLTATFNKNGGGTLKGELAPVHYTTVANDQRSISIDSPFSGGTPWSGANDNKQRFIVLEGVTWSGKTGAQVRFKGKAKVVTRDDNGVETVVTAYNSYDDGEANAESVDGTFAGPGGQEIVAEIRLKATGTTDPTILGGISGHNYAPADN